MAGMMVLSAPAIRSPTPWPKHYNTLAQAGHGFRLEQGVRAWIWPRRSRLRVAEASDWLERRGQEAAVLDRSQVPEGAMPNEAARHAGQELSEGTC